MTAGFCMVVLLCGSMPILVCPAGADTPDELVQLLENVLVECTSYQVAGQPMSKADSERLEEEITEAVLQVCRIVCIRSLGLNMSRGCIMCCLLPCCIATPWASRMHGLTASIFMTPQSATMHWLHTCTPYIAHHKSASLTSQNLVGRLRAAPNTCEQPTNAASTKNPQGVMSHLWLLSPAFTI